MLGFLRKLERGLGTAVLLVHHSRKSGHARAVQALRGSSELHAWGDSNLYLRRRDDGLLLAAEHRAALPLDELTIELVERGDELALATAAPRPTNSRHRARQAHARGSRSPRANSATTSPA